MIFIMIGHQVGQKIMSFIVGLDHLNLQNDMHSEFGEGFDEDDHQGHQYASYIVNVDGLNFHIGYDHRGTSVEVESTKGEPSPERLFKAMCALVDIYKEKNT